MTFHERSHAQNSEFLDHLSDWMDRAPWVAISAAAHVIAFLIMAIIPWSLLKEAETTTLTTSIAPPVIDVFDPPPIEDKPKIEDPEIPNDLTPLEPIDITQPVDPVDFSDEPNDTDLQDLSNSPFDNVGELSLVGIGGNSGGPMGQRFGDGTGGGRPRTGQYGPTVSEALDWLAAHQAPSGAWDCDGFSERCGSLGASVCDGPGESIHDVGVTGLALLAFLGTGNSTRQGHYREKVARGIHWLQAQQDPDSGLIGERIGSSYLYDHAIASLALCEAYYLSKTPIHRRAAQRAINYISVARNPYGAWRYDCPPIGDNDTSVTGWMVFALKAAQEAGLVVDPQAFHGALSFFDEVTDPATGRTGYDSIGSVSSRISGLNDHYSTEGTEAMTAVSLLSRIFMGEDMKKNPSLMLQADLLRKSLPQKENRDMYYWYYGTYAMYQVGGKHWRAWSQSLKHAIVDTQRRDGDFKGSWDPNGPWGFSGGRVYSTALMALSLQVHYRYSRLLGTR